MLDGVFQWKHLLSTDATSSLSSSTILLIRLTSLRPGLLALSSSVALLLWLMVARLRIHGVAITLSSSVLRLVIAASLEVAVLVGGVCALL